MEGMKMIIERIFEMPNKWTFQMPKLRKWVLQWLPVGGKVLNIFAGKTKLNEYNGAIIYNDINPDLDVDYHYDAMEISKYFEPKSFDAILFDPPYTYHQTTRQYGGKTHIIVTKAKMEADKLLKAGGIVVSLGFNSTGFSKKRGYKKLGILLVNCGGEHNDIIVTVEQKIKQDIRKWIK